MDPSDKMPCGLREAAQRNRQAHRGLVVAIARALAVFRESGEGRCQAEVDDKPEAFVDARSHELDATSR